MKQLFLRSLSALLLLLCLSACGSVGSISGGLHDEAYLTIASSGKYLRHEVEVRIDDVSTVRIVPVKPQHVSRSAKRITINPGRHHILVRDARGQVIFAKEVFVSSRSAKTITLR